MDKNSRFLLAIILGLAISGQACAADFIQTNVFSNGAEEVLTNGLFISAKAIQIKGTAKNDLFLLATGESWQPQNKSDGDILLAGKFENDVWALGNTITLTGIIQDHARLLARLILISGSVSNSSILIANSIQITQSARMGSDVRFIGENVIVEGAIAGDLNIIAKNVTLSSTCSGNVELAAADIAVLPSARIGGNLIYRSPQELVLDKNVVLRGNLVRGEEEVTKEARRPFFSWSSLAIQSWFFIGALGAGALMLFLFPAFIENGARQINSSAWKCLLVGFVAACLIPLACFFLALSVIGLPIALLSAAFFVILSYVSKITVALVIGNFIIRRKAQGIKAFPAMGLGLVFLYLAAGAGLLGVIIGFLIVCLGLGGMITGYLSRRSASTT